MASDTAADCSMNLRLLINKKSGKILYAEAGKDFVDLLFSFLTLPTGSVIKLLSALKRANRVGCLTNIYNSVEKLQSMFMQNADKSPLLQPNVMSTIPNDILRIQSAPTVYYVCGSQRGGNTHYMTIQSGGRCHCGETMRYPVKMHNPSMQVNSTVTCSGSEGDSGGSESESGKWKVESESESESSESSESESESSESESGYVKETVTFIITNELEISPASTITSIKLLNKLKVKDLSDLDERNASVGPNEALDLLCACLVSATALDDVFGAATSECSPRPEGGVPSGESVEKSYETAEILEDIVH